MQLLKSAILGHYENGDVRRADCLIGHSFGTLTSPDSVNVLLAQTVLKYYANDKPLLVDYVFAEALPTDSPEPDLVVEGQISTTLGGGTGTWGTLLCAKEYMEKHELVRPLIVAQAFHAGRVSMQATKLGMDPILPPDLPRQFDTNSSQPWTRSRISWIPREIMGAVVLKLTGHL